MQLKDICDVLEIEKSTKVFFVKKQVDNIDPLPIGTKLWSEEMITDLNNKEFSPSKPYDRSQIGIYIPNIDIQEFYDFQKEKASVDFREIKDKLRVEYKIAIEDLVVAYSIFFILHEEGHWKYYLYCRDKCKMSDEQIYEEYFNPLQAVEYKKKQISQMESEKEDSSKIFIEEKGLYGLYRNSSRKCSG